MIETGSLAPHLMDREQLCKGISPVNVKKNMKKQIAIEIIFIPKCSPWCTELMTKSLLKSALRKTFYSGLKFIEK